MIESSLAVGMLAGASAPSAPRTAVGRPGGGSSFAFELAQSTKHSTREQVRESASKLVASAFIQPILAQMHETSFVSGRFAPGDAERRFTPMLHQHLADGIGTATSFPLVDAIVDRLLGPSSSVGRGPGRGGSP